MLKSLFFCFLYLSALINLGYGDTIPPSRTIKTKSPTRALFYSALLPGAGQFYTENYLKGIAFLLAEGTMAYFACKNPEKRDDLIWLLAGCHIFNIADAYISAHLYKFREQTKLTLRFSNNEISLFIVYQGAIFY